MNLVYDLNLGALVSSSRRGLIIPALLQFMEPNNTVDEKMVQNSNALFKYPIFLMSQASVSRLKVGTQKSKQHWWPSVVMELELSLK